VVWTKPSKRPFRPFVHFSLVFTPFDVAIVIDWTVACIVVFLGPIIMSRTKCTKCSTEGQIPISGDLFLKKPELTATQSSFFLDTI
jgi:hypothetical protein